MDIAENNDQKGVVKRGRGRPRKDVELKYVDELCKYHCTVEEIVDILNLFEKGVSYDTVERRIKEKHNMTFGEYVKARHRVNAKPRLRRMQWEAAEKGNPTMLIWLGKQYLKQSDKSETEISGDSISIIVQPAERGDDNESKDS